MLDEPTSGLDPVSRDELLDVFLDLSGRGIAILFSTHITSDLEVCADDIVYIKNGAIVTAGRMKEWVSEYRVVRFGAENPSEEIMESLIGYKRVKEGHKALVVAGDAARLGAACLSIEKADLESIMIHMEAD